VLVPILPEDRAFNYIPAIVVSPARLSGVPHEKLEEQVRRGSHPLDWWHRRLDSRPGGRPYWLSGDLHTTLEQRDYEFEFLARIDHHSVNWVFRARRPQRLLPCFHHPHARWKLSSSSAAALWATPANSPTPLRLQMPLNRKNAVTIKLHAVGTDFSVSLDDR